MLYELLTGRPPFNGATSLAVVQQHVRTTPAPPDRLRPEIPQPLSDYVLRLLAKDPAHRPTAEQVADWLSGVHGTPQPAEPDRTTLMPDPAIPSPSAPHTGQSPTSAHSRPRGRRKLASKAVLGGVGLALFAGAAALGASLNSGDDAPTAPTSPTGTSVPARQTPTTTPPSATQSATTPPAPQHGDDDSDEQSGKHGDRKDKGKGRHSDD
ncbi:hypothetical protein GCM10010350_76680 [Streptomyces galilaeus]|nr:hypothetical protein GCM10010350_76680 [Streptomyces galilaeus]